MDPAMQHLSKSYALADKIRDAAGSIKAHYGSRADCVTCEREVAVDKSKQNCVSVRIPDPKNTGVLLEELHRQNPAAKKEIWKPASTMRELYYCVMFDMVAGYLGPSWWALVLDEATLVACYVLQVEKEADPAVLLGAGIVMKQYLGADGQLEAIMRVRATNQTQIQNLLKS